MTDISFPLAVAISALGWSLIVWSVAEAYANQNPSTFRRGAMSAALFIAGVVCEISVWNWK